MTTLAAVAKAQTERLGRRIRERREELDLKQREVAARMTASPGTDAQMISKWERGEHRPNDDNLEILAEALETTVADLISGPLAERRPKGATPDLGATFNGTMPDELRELLRAIEARLGAIEKDQAKLLRRLGTVSGDHNLIEETHRAVAELLGQPGESDPPADEGGTRRATG